MSLVRVVSLRCDAAGCDRRWPGTEGDTGEQTRRLAARDGWTSAGTGDRCPEHPRRTLSPRNRLGPVLLRIYGLDGLLLYVGTTRGSPNVRLRAMRYTDWWFLADPRATLVDVLPAGTDLDAERKRVAEREHPRYHRDEHGNLPYVRSRRYVRPDRACTPLARLQEKRGTG